MTQNRLMEKKHKLKEELHQIIFEADTSMGKLFDVLLLVFFIHSNGFSPLYLPLNMFYEFIRLKNL